MIAAEKLSHTLRRKHQITMVSRNRKFTFYPALVQLAFGNCEPDDITFDLAAKLHRLNVRFVQGECLNVNYENSSVQITGKDFQGEIFYDYLIIACGRRLATERIGGFSEYANHLLGVNEALEFGEEVRNFKRGEIVVGFAPDSSLPVPVCETAFALANKFKSEIERKDISVAVIFPEHIKHAFGGAKLHFAIIEAFAKHHIKVVTKFAVRQINENELIGYENKSLRYDLLMLLPPFRGLKLIEKIESTDDSGFLMVDRFLRVQGLKKIYGVGDTVSFPGPKLAAAAVRQGEIAAANIISEIRGEEPSTAYRHEIKTIIDQGGTETIYFHYGVWNRTLYSLKKGTIWSWAKTIHHKFWKSVHDGL